MTTQKLQHYVNHISLVVDKSSSMSPHSNTVVKVFDKELAYLKQRSIDLNQETRISIYLFNEGLEVLTFDMDVMRFNSLAGFYLAHGSTALMDAVAQSIEDHQKLPELYGDHAFLQYVITDGEENMSRKTNVHSLKSQLNSLPPHWTIAALVPDARGKFEAQKFGFNTDSIAIWDTTSAKGFEAVGKQFSHVMDNYMTMRASGVRGTTGLFTLDSSKLNTPVVNQQLQELLPTTYDVYRVDREIPIKPFVESWTQKPYRLGSTYYQPVKTVKIQDHKNILIQNTHDGKVYWGHNLRQLLGLPDQTAEVNPGNHKDWRILVQSTSVNRKLYPNTYVLVRK
jgi:hypothetical protein